MIYCFDNSSLKVLSNYYPDRFPKFWERFEDLIVQGDVISVREVKSELDAYASEPWFSEWLSSQKHIFLMPTPAEGEFVAKIFAVPHFQQLVGLKQQLAGKPVADPWVIASAGARGGTVVTEESQLKHNAARIPNVCDHFEVPCINVRSFLQAVDWTF